MMTLKTTNLGGDLFAGKALPAQRLDRLDNGFRGRLAQTMRPR
jgi:hypothetical protein